MEGTQWRDFARYDVGEAVSSLFGLHEVVKNGTLSVNPFQEFRNITIKNSTLVPFSFSGDTPSDTDFKFGFTDCDRVDEDLAALAAIVNELKNEFSNYEITYEGERRKVVAVHSDGTIHANIKGSASQIGGVNVDTVEIKNGQVLIYNEASNTFAPGKAGGLSSEDIAQTEADIGKLVALDGSGTIPFSITGNAGQLLSKNVTGDKIEDGQVLVYRESIDAWQPENKGGRPWKRKSALY